MSSTHCSAILRTSSRLRPPKGCGITAIGNAPLPSARACARPSVRNAVEHTVMAALPCFATSMLSWILHDAHDPQSPEPAMTTSHSPDNSAITAASAGRDADDLRRLITFAAP